MKLKFTVAFAVMFLFVSGAQAEDSRRDTHENLNSVLWVQTSVEYQMVVTAAYRNARTAVRQAMKDRTWTAAAEQAGKGYSSLPPAIIVDVDETVLDNSRFQAQMVRDKGVYDRTEKKWNDWVCLSAAGPIPGAVDFLNWAVSEYPVITVFYVTNRASEVEAHTRINLEKYRFPLKEGIDVILTKGEDGQETSDKSLRREKIARQYRIILIVGDDLGDFISPKGTMAERKALAEKFQPYWGERWVIIPNPVYGSWERTLYPRDCDDEKSLKSKFEKLRTIQ